MNFSHIDFSPGLALPWIGIQLLDLHGPRQDEAILTGVRNTSYAIVEVARTERRAPKLGIAATCPPTHAEISLFSLRISD
jgi:hypothetical protein